MGDDAQRVSAASLCYDFAMDRSDTILAIGLGVFVIALIGAAGKWGDAAGWAQAIGTVAAILAAAQIARRQQVETANAARADRAGRARTLAARLLPMVVDMEVEIGRIRGSCNVHDYGRSVLDGMRNVSARTGMLDASEAKKQMLFNLAWRDNIYDHFDALPPLLAQTMAQLLYEVAAYDRIVGGLLEHGALYGTHVIDDLQDVVEPMLDDIGRMLATASPALKALMTPYPSAAPR